MRHEDLARDPVAGFSDLYTRLGLNLSQGVRRRIARPADRPDLFARASLFARQRYTARSGRTHAAAVRQRITPAEIETVTAKVGPLLQHFYEYDE